jgi:hypothetical protein
MRRLIVCLTILQLLAACERYSGGPLPHALAALRDGDYDDFLAAKKESEEEIKGAIHANDDLCLTSPRDFTKYRSQYAISRMDHKELFALSEDERLLYALKVASMPRLEPGSFLEHAPVTRMSGFTPVCQDEHEKMMAALQSDGGYSIDVNEGRLRLLQGWLAEVKAKYGSQMDEKMHAAAAHLDAAGYSAKWPADPVDG